MYTSNFIMVVVVDGKIQRESHNGVLAIPFGSEFSIRLKNKNSKRAIAKLSIDGENVGDFIIEANSHWDIERSVHNDKKFCFASIESEAAYDEGKNDFSPKDFHGLIECKFALEANSYYNPTLVIGDGINGWYQKPWNWNQPYYEPWNWNQPYYGSHTIRGLGGGYSCSNGTSKSQSLNGINPQYSCNNASLQGSCLSNSFNCSLDFNMPLEAGVVVEGSQSSQTFQSTYFKDDGVFTTLRIKLKGYNANQITTQERVALQQFQMQKNPFTQNSPFTQSEEDLKLKELNAKLEKLKLIKELEKQIAELKQTV